jgi:hypothetical protein
MRRDWGKAIRTAVYVVEMDDGTRWGVPVAAIALHRAAHFADYFDGNTARSLEEETWPLFENDEHEVIDWACGNMDWHDVASIAREIRDEPTPAAYQSAWVSGPHEIRDPEACPGWDKE